MCIEQPKRKKLAQYIITVGVWCIKAITKFLVFMADIPLAFAAMSNIMAKDRYGTNQCIIPRWYLRQLGVLSGIPSNASGITLPAIEAIVANPSPVKVYIVAPVIILWLIHFIKTYYFFFEKSEKLACSAFPV